MMVKYFVLLFCIFLNGCQPADQKKDGTKFDGLVDAQDDSTYKIIKVTPLESASNVSALKAALDQAKGLLAQDVPVIVELTEEVYYLDQPIVLDSSYSGTEKFPFVLRTENSKQAVLSAGQKLDLKWQVHSDGIYKARVNLESIDQLFIDGVRQVRARYPNYDLSISVFNGFSADAISPKRITHWKNPIGGVVHSLHEGRWGGMHHVIVDRSENGELVLEGGHQNNRASPKHKKYRYVENIFEELDAPREWFYSKDDAMLYYFPEKKTDLASATVEVTQLPHILEIRGEANAPVINVRVEGVEFVHTSQTFMQTREPLLRSDWAVYRGGAILIEQAENVQIRNNDFHSLGGNAVFVSNYTRNIEISGNHIRNIGASAISFVGSPDAVRSPSFEYNEFVPIDEIDFKPGPKTNNYPKESIATDNLIHDIGWVEKQVAGVQISMASDITVSHNSIYRVPRAGINISEGTWGGHLLEYNDVFDTVLETGDHGAFNSWGRDRFWHPDRAVMDQIAKDHPGMWELDAQKPTIIRNSRWQCDHGWDIDLDDGSSNYQIYNNVMLNGGLKLREGFHRIAENNIILNNSFHPHVWFEESEDVFRHNLVIAGHKPILNEHWGKKVDYNFFATQNGLDKAQALGLDENSTLFNVDFIDARSGDYRLPEDALAIKNGFKNFPMDQFGVKSERLKKIADQPEFPELFLGSSGEEKGKELSLLGATFKSLETLGEQSALGASEIAGVMVLTVERGSIAEREGLKIKDLILKVEDRTFGGGDDINNINDLLNSYQSRKWRGVLEIIVLRNQQEIPLSIDLLE